MAGFLQRFARVFEGPDSHSEEYQREVAELERKEHRQKKPERDEKMNERLQGRKAPQTENKL